MAHYAFIDDDNIVVEVCPGHDEGQGIDWEAYYSERRGLLCRRTSYNARDGINTRTGGPGYRQNYAGIGYRWVPSFGPDGAFLPPE